MIPPIDPYMLGSYDANHNGRFRPFLSTQNFRDVGRYIKGYFVNKFAFDFPDFLGFFRETQIHEALSKCLRSKASRLESETSDSH
jgi:hypothetical protein